MRNTTHADNNVPNDLYLLKGTERLFKEYDHGNLIYFHCSVRFD